MSLRVTGSNRRLSVRLPAEGETLVRQGDELVGAPAGGGDIEVEGDIAISSSAGNILIFADPNPDEPGATGKVRIQCDRLSLDVSRIGEFGFAGTGPLANIPAVTDEASVVAGFNLLRAYLIARGTMEAD